MPESEPFISIEDEKQPLDRQLRFMASELGFVETPKIQDAFRQARPTEDAHKIIEKYSDELERVSHENPTPDFLVAAALIEAAIQLKAGNISEAYNNLADAADILTGERTHPDILTKIDAILETL